MTAPPPSRRFPRRIRDAAGTAATVAVLIAVPAVLTRWVGIPLPRGGAQGTAVSWSGLLDLLSLVAWAAWAGCIWAIARGVTRRVRTRDVAGASRPFDRVAARIAIVLLGISSALGAGAGAAGAAPRTPASVQTATRTSTGPTTATAGTPRGILAGATSTDRAARSAPSREPSGAPFPIAPAVPLLGAGAIVAALVARRAAQVRRARGLARVEGSPPWVPSEGAADLAIAVAPFVLEPGLEHVEGAMRHLRARAESAPLPLPAARWVRVGPDAVEVGLAHPPAWTPEGWQRTERPSVIVPVSAPALRPPDLGTTLECQDPWCPVLLPLGEDRRGSWLLPLEAGATVAVVGPSAAPLARAMRAGASGWAWHESVVVTDDPAVATAAAPTALTPRGSSAPATRVLFVGDPRSLDPPTRRVCAVLTTVPLASAGITVLVDSRAATVHPIGLSVRPHLLDASLVPALDEIAGTGRAAADGDRTDIGEERAGHAPGQDGTGRTELLWSTTTRALAHHRPGATTIAIRTPGAADRRADPGDRADPDRRADPGDRAEDADRTHRGTRTGGAELGAAGPVEVKLLAAVPGVEGLHAPLPPKRARRATELIAYLAVHGPDAVTGDRLRTRVLGTADADAARKTLFNVAGAARQALGAGPDGTPLFPHATRSGHYRLSPLITVDALRMERALRAGLCAPDLSGATELLHAGLDLVSGEPLGSALTGYEWWRAEGHERRIADVVVDAACALAREAVREGRIDLARWAVDRARLVEHYSEALCRAAMQVAAAGGDARRLRSEWLECRRQVDEVDPGGSPSEPTEQLYARLRAQLASGARTPQRSALDDPGVLV